MVRSREHGVSSVCERGVADVDSGQWQCNWIFRADACYTGISAGSTGDGEGSGGTLIDVVDKLDD